MISLWVKVDLGVIAMKGHPTLPRSPEMEPQYQMLFSVIYPGPPFWWSFTLLRDIQSVYSKPHYRAIYLSLYLSVCMYVSIYMCMHKTIYIPSFLSYSFLLNYPWLMLASFLFFYFANTCSSFFRTNKQQDRMWWASADPWWRICTFNSCSMHLPLYANISSYANIYINC